MRFPKTNEDSQRQASDQSPTSDRPQTAQRLKFPKKLRLLTPHDFKRIGREGQKKSGNTISTVSRLGQSSHPRLGITVSRRFGKAHDRVRFKRLVREAFRTCQAKLAPGLEIVVFPKVGPFSKQSILEDFLSLYAQCPTKKGC
jgi:ribonuclease P protein component